ncbi:hypothetical protein CYQ88_03220 [Hydrogenovibrio sp. SC-1]|uniref:hypothetical protein n=1 Tax=Hydrogenovibrio sp. SC-1 TaxID=2065820 RepID=UPI000C7D237F|nr:hypothetical protein [Hydrogenovibrio sp. SC-1]PLA74928.1 hypothetical protein CYQ88_03220 [Hydrogenovibrio sp. SC-1]
MNRVGHNRLVLLGLSLICWFGNVQAQTAPNRCVVVTGTASLDGVTEEFARQMAIRNGLKLASMQNNLSISSDQVVTNYTLHKDMTHFTSQSKVSNFAIVEEGVKSPEFDDLFDKTGQKIEDPSALRKLKTYQVKLEVCLTENPQACNSVPGNHLQPKLAIARPVISDSYQARDISNLLIGYQSELERRLQKEGYQNLVAIEEASVVDTRQPIAPNLSPEVLEPIRETTGAEYVLLTVIRSVSAHNEDSAAWNKIKRFYNHEIEPNARYLEIEFFVVDLIHYEVISQYREGFDVKGDVKVGRERPFGTSAFFATDTGMVFDAILRQQTQAVFKRLKCQPVETQIIDVRDGEYILYLSRASGARVGDEFAVYHRQGRPVRYQGVLLGADSMPSGFLKVTRIHAKFAVAEVLAKQGLMEVGDSVKSW